MISPLQAYIARSLQTQALQLSSTAQRLGFSAQEMTDHIQSLIHRGMPIQIIDDHAHLLHHDPINVRARDKIFHLHYPITTSTQDIILAMTPRDNEFIVASADFQTQGRGQHKKKWLSSYGSHILASLLIPKIQCPIPWPLLSGYIIANWLSQNFHINSLMIKWPNDIMIGDLKLCGILHEPHHHPDYWIMGFGLNIHADPHIQANISQPATTLSETLGISLNRGHILQNITQSLCDSLSSQESVDLLSTEFLKHFPKYDFFLNKPISTIINQKNFYGIGRGINSHGQYLLETIEGDIITNNSASIRLERRTSH